MCDSFLGEGKVGVNQAAKPLPATSHPTAPLPEEGIYPEELNLSNTLIGNPD
jgi:hypothetical protein